MLLNIKGRPSRLVDIQESSYSCDMVQSISRLIQLTFDPHLHNARCLPNPICESAVICAWLRRWESCSFLGYIIQFRNPLAHMYEANHYIVYGFNIPIFSLSTKNIKKVCWSLRKCCDLNQAILVHTSPCTHKLGLYSRTLRPGKVITSTPWQTILV